MEEPDPPTLDYQEVPHRRPGLFVSDAGCGVVLVTLVLAGLLPGVGLVVWALSHAGAPAQR